MIDPLRFDLHIFDLDDTLVNTKEAYWFAQIEAIRETFPDISSESFVKLNLRLKWLCNIFGSSKVKEYMEAFLKSEPDLFRYTNDDLDKIITRYQKLFRKQFSAFENANDFLKHLTEAGKTIFLVSNGREESQINKLKRTDLIAFFSESSILVSSQFPKHLEKPSPHMVQKACFDAKVPPEKTIFYGNSDIDILAGNLAGVTTAHFAKTTRLSNDIPQIATPDFSFNNWSDLL